MLPIIQQTNKHQTPIFYSVLGIIIFLFFLTPSFTYGQKKDTTSIFNKVNKLDEVVIKGRKTSIVRKIKKSPVAVEVIELGPVLHKGGDITALLSKAPGVSVRSDGGVGDQINFSINGMDKKAIAIFKDGVPMSFYGHAFSPSMISPNMFERIEIYKGVLPIAFGADALGGAINFVTRQPKKKTIEVSSEIGSFATIRNSLNMFFPNKKNNFYIGANAAYTSSDNNWKVDVGRVKDNGISVYDQSVMAPLKHNEASMHNIEAFVGLKNRTWVDDMRLSFINSYFLRNINHLPLSADILHSTAVSLYALGDEKTNTGVFTFKKKLFNKKLAIDVMAGYTKSNAKLTDTLDVNLDRFGTITDKIEFTNNPNNKRVGQFLDGGILTNLENTQKALRIGVSYNLYKKNYLQFNHTYTSNNRIGFDPLGGIIKKDGKDVDIYKTPATHQKTITAFGLESHFFNKKLQTIIGYKIYQRGAEGFSPIQSLFKKNSVVTSNDSGIMFGVSYTPTKRWLIKSSYEDTTRMPDDFEVYGFLPWFIASNFNIVPEDSKNANFQVQYTRKKWMISASAFYRDTNNFIFLQPGIPYYFHRNMFESFAIRTKGVELDFSYAPFSFLDVGGNAMYLERRYHILDVATAPKQFIGRTSDDTFSNTPPLLMNANATLHWDDAFKKGDRAELYWYWNYVHRYQVNPFAITNLGLFEKEKNEQRYRDWVPLNGDLAQVNHTAGIAYTFAKPNLSLSAEVRNIGNNIMYSNQSSLPMRSFSFKARWQFNFED